MISLSLSHPSFVPCRVEVQSHCVKWDQEFEFPCKMYASASTAELEPCFCKISIRKVSIFFLFAEFLTKYVVTVENRFLPLWLRVIVSVFVYAGSWFGS